MNTRSAVKTHFNLKIDKYLYDGILCLSAIC